jgi:hypothetical protein
MAGGQCLSLLAEDANTEQLSVMVRQFWKHVRVSNYDVGYPDVFFVEFLRLSTFCVCVCVCVCERERESLDMQN